MRIQIIAISSVICLVLALTLTVRRCRTIQADRDRLLQNQSHLLHNGHVEISTTANGSSLATAPAIVLKSSEFRQSADPMPRLAKDMGIRPSRIREAATAAAVTRASLTLSLTPSTQASDTSALSSLSYHSFSYTDPWLTLAATIHPDTPTVSPPLTEGGGGETPPGQVVDLNLQSRDTLDIIVHRVPKRFLFFRFGCKAVNMSISSRNPHTHLTYARYYQLTD